MGILEVPRNDRDFEDKSENDEVAQEDNVEEGNHYLYQLNVILLFNTQLSDPSEKCKKKNPLKPKLLHFLFDMGITYESPRKKKGCFRT